MAGIDQSDMLREHKIGFVVRTCACEFLKPAMLDDLLTIETRLLDISKVSIELQQTVRRGKETLVTIEVKLVVVGALKLTKIPEFVREAMLEVFT